MYLMIFDDNKGISLLIHKNIYCGCSLELPGRGDSEHPQHRFLAHLSRRLKGELIVYRSIRRLLVSASVNIFQLEYLRNQLANRNQILSEASLGWGIDCIRFWTR